MSVRKRTWKTGKGQTREKWVVDYIDQHGTRRLKTFERKKEADAFNDTMRVEVRDGLHVPDSTTVTVEEAGLSWIASCEADKKERTTVDAYKSALKYHINPMIGSMKLSKITVPAVTTFRDRLFNEPYPDDFPAARMRGKKRSTAMIKRVVMSLGALLGDAQERGTVVRNAVHELAHKKRGRAKGDSRQKIRPRVGIDIPLNDEIRAMLDKATGRYRPLLITAVFTGCRASELRGLTWSHVDLDNRRVVVSQRVDKYSVMGSTKSQAGQRTIPIPPMAVNTLREWKLQCPTSESNLVFPTSTGGADSHGNIVTRGLQPAFIAAGITTDSGEKDAKGNPILKAKYTGMHCLRHWFASWCINRKVDGGLELTPKMVQQRMGHSSIAQTMDTYGHLFPETDEAESLAAAEVALLKSVRAT